MNIIENENYCAYLRKSRTDRDAELSSNEDTLARHKRILEELASKMGVKIEKFYCEVVSGDTISDRPRVQELLADVERGCWTGVFVVEVERLARGNTRDQGIVSDCFKYSSTKIITPVKTYDPNNEFDEEYFEFGLFMARREFKMITRRLQRGRIASVTEGKYISSTAPYGYTRVKIPKDKGYTLEIVDEEAKVVRMIFDWYCNGVVLDDGSRAAFGADRIARRLDSLGIHPRSSSSWSKATVNDMLSNPTYCGDVRHGYRKYSKAISNGNITKRRTVNDKCTQNTGRHPAIIDRELFDKVQQMKKINKKNTTPSNMTLQNPLSGLVYCKKCGTMMTRLAPNSRNKYSTLKCPNRYCNNISSPLFLVEEHVLKFLEKWVNNYKVNPTSFVPNSSMDKEINLLKNSISSNQSEIDKLRNQLAKACDFLEQGIYTVEDFNGRREILSRNINNLTAANEKYYADLKKYEEVKYSYEQFTPQITHLLETYSSCTPEVQNQLLKNVIEKIEYEKEHPNTRGKLYNANFTLHIHPKLPQN